MERQYRRFKSRTRSARPLARRPAVARRSGARARGRYMIRKRRYMNLAYAGVIGMELKFQDTIFSGTVAWNNSSSSCQVTPSSTEMFVCPIVGDGPSNRDGSKIRLKSLHFRGEINFPAQTHASALGAPQVPDAYIYVIRDKQCNGALANSNQVFDNTYAHADLTGLSMRDISTTMRFDVLKKVRVELPTPQVVSNSATAPTLFYMSAVGRDFEIYLKLDDLVTFNASAAGTTNDVGNLTNNNYFLVIMATGDSATTLYHRGVCRARFLG